MVLRVGKLATCSRPALSSASSSRRCATTGSNASTVRRPARWLSRRGGAPPPVGHGVPSSPVAPTPCQRRGVEAQDEAHPTVFGLKGELGLRSRVEIVPGGARRPSTGPRRCSRTTSEGGSACGPLRSGPCARARSAGRKATAPRASRETIVRRVRARRRRRLPRLVPEPKDAGLAPRRLRQMHEPPRAISSAAGRAVRARDPTAFTTEGRLGHRRAGAPR